MYLYKLVISVDAYSETEKGHFTLTEFELNVKETKQSYTGEKLRISKEKIGEIQNVHNANHSIMYMMYSLKKSDPFDYKRLEEAVRETLHKREMKMVKMKEAVSLPLAATFYKSE